MKQGRGGRVGHLGGGREGGGERRGSPWPVGINQSGDIRGYKCHLFLCKIRICSWCFSKIRI